MTYELLNIETVIGQALFWSFILGGVYAYLAKRDPSERKQQKGIFLKIIPWILLCVVFLEFFILIVRTVDYPWKYNLSLQIQNRLILNLQRGVIHGCCLTVYAFMFKSSDTSWWKKICKVIAYVTLSLLIIVFDLNNLFLDVYIIQYSTMLVFSIILLIIAHVRPSKKECNSLAITSAESTQATIEEAMEESEDTQKESASRFIPNIVNEEKTLSHTLEESIPIKQEKAKQEAETPICESDMMYCKFCGNKIKADSTFCRYCGKKQLMTNDTTISKRLLEWCSKKKWYLIVYAIYFLIVLILILDEYHRVDMQSFIAFEILAPLVLYTLVAVVRYLKNKL